LFALGKLALGKLPRSAADEYPRGVAGLAGRGTLARLRGGPDRSLLRGAGELPRELPGSALRGALFDGRSMLRGAPADDPSLRGMLADGGRGTPPRDAISGADDRASDDRASGREISGRTFWGPGTGLATFERGLFSGPDLMLP